MQEEREGFVKKHSPSLTQFLFAIQFLMFWSFQTAIVAVWWNEKVGFNDLLGLSLGAMMLIVLGPLVIFLVGQSMLRELRTEVDIAKREIKDLQAKRRDIIPRHWRREIIERDNCTCTYCGRRGDLELGPDGRPWNLDHIIPQGRGGPTHKENLTLSCSKCNLAKGDKATFEYLRYCETQNNGRVKERMKA